MAAPLDIALRSEADLAYRWGSMAMPPPAPLAMEAQDLARAPAETHPITPTSRTRLARLLVVGGTLAGTAAGVAEMVHVVSDGGINGLEWPFLIFFALTFCWIVYAAMAAVAGVLFAPPAPRPASSASDPDPDAPPPAGATGRTAIVMPVYNEDPAPTGAALQAMAEALIEAGRAHGFEIVILSDSTDSNAWIRETLCVQRLRAALEPRVPVWYRRRWRNTARKAGNVAQFVRNWGGRYDFMFVLDADSIMEAGTLVRMVDAMRADPTLGILQTSPQLAGSHTLFARLQQFASWLHGPIVARGIAAWSGDDGNFWGHNAIIRVRAFAQGCGLPDLPGKKPFGGHIMSHDFVEAALMRRAGWAVRLDPELTGSYEDSPPSLLDLAARDRRWAQGNLQHGAVIGAAGFKPSNRAHFAIGIMSYISSPLWLALIVTGLGLALQAHFIRPEYFAENQMFPTWPQFDAERMLRIFVITMSVLLLPKLIGLLRQLLRPAPGITRGGVTAGALGEVLVSAFYAPIMMVMQTRQLCDILWGRDSGWNTQRRAGEGDPWGLIWKRHRAHMIGGVAAAALVFSVDTTLFLWLSPTLAGLLLAVPLSWVSGREDVGRWLRAKGLFITAHEARIPPIVARRDALLEALEPLPEDGLAHLARQPGAIDAHIAANMEPPGDERGQPDPHHLTAGRKIADAASRAQALAWLTPPERVRVAGDAVLLEMLAALPEARDER